MAETDCPVDLLEGVQPKEEFRGIAEPDIAIGAKLAEDAGPKVVMNR